MLDQSTFFSFKNGSTSCSFFSFSEVEIFRLLNELGQRWMIFILHKMASDVRRCGGRKRMLEQFSFSLPILAGGFG